jgi:glycosyltransferase involved in cell wall biosynthesis
MRVLIATAQVPFIRGGAELLAEGLRAALRAEGCEVDIVAIPFKWYPPACILDHMLACRLLDLTESSGAPIDRIIGLKFPAYLIPHPNKVLWILHQHRSAYDLWDRGLSDLQDVANGVLVREAIRQADERLLPEAKAIFTIAKNVSQRLHKYNGIDSSPLYHPPPNAEQFYCAPSEEYFFFPSRLASLKRQALVLKALALTPKTVRVRFAGTPEHPALFQELQMLAGQLKIENRVEWLGAVTDAEKVQLYAQALGVIFPPIDEDYGYVTLEAMASAKPVITCSDSGGPLEFIEPEETGLIVEPTPEALAIAMERVWKSREEAKQLGARAKEKYTALGVSWRNVVERLLA